MPTSRLSSLAFFIAYVVATCTRPHRDPPCCIRHSAAALSADVAKSALLRLAVGCPTRPFSCRYRQAAASFFIAPPELASKYRRAINRRGQSGPDVDYLSDRGSSGDGRTATMAEVGCGWLQKARLSAAP